MNHWVTPNMVRISNSSGSKVAYALFASYIIAVPLVAGIMLLGIPDLWVISGLDKLLVRDDTWFIFTVFFRIQFYAALLFPITLIYAFRTMPRRLTFTETGICAHFWKKEEHFSYQSVESIRFSDDENGATFMHLNLGRRKLTIEVSIGQIGQINDYLPVSLLGE